MPINMKFNMKKWKNKYLQEKIGFRGPDYSDETKDLFSDFQSSVEMLNKEFGEKSVSSDSPEVQEILTTLDDTLNPEFIENLDTILSLIRELPDKPEKQKIGFKEGKKKGLDGKACWDGYKLQGTKMKGGKRVDNCVPIKETSISEGHGLSKEDAKDLKRIIDFILKSNIEQDNTKDLSKDEQKRPDYPDVDGDGDTKEPMEKAFRDKNKVNEDLKKLKDKIKKTLEKEGGAAGLKPLKKATNMSTKDLEQTLDKMGNVKKHKHDDYILTPIEEDMYEGGCMEEDMYEGGCMEEEHNTDTLEEVYIIESEDEIQMIEDALNEEEEEMEEGRKKGKCKPSKGKRFAKRVDGKCRSFGQKGKASDGGDRIRPGTKKAHAYCARSAKIKKCKNPPCANTLSRRKWKCQGSRSVPESIQEIKRFQKLAGIIK